MLYAPSCEHAYTLFEEENIESILGILEGAPDSANSTGFKAGFGPDD